MSSMGTKSHSTKISRVDSLMEQASEALVATRYFECERLALEALGLARASQDYERMARITLPLQEARRQKRQIASERRRVIRLDSVEKLEPLLSGQKKIVAGCYLIEPLLVGADGRDLRERADGQEAAVIVVAREPVTRLGAWPVVMVGPVTVRTHFAAPAKEKPDVAWMLGAGEALGDSAIESVDAGMDPMMRVERLADLLATVVDHEKLHQALAEACRAAEQTMREAEARPRGRRAPATLAERILEEEVEEEE